MKKFQWTSEKIERIEREKEKRFIERDCGYTHTIHTMINDEIAS